MIYSLTDEIIQQCEDEINNLNTTRNEEKRTHKTFFDIQMDACSKENFTRKEISDNVLTMLLSSSDTIIATMNYVLFILANFPKIQEKIYEEMLEIYGTETVKSAPIKYHDLQNMHYLDRVIKETLRMFPTIPIIGRQVMEDLKIGEVMIPKGADIFIPIIKMHRDEKYWSNPLVFDPDRFLPERIKDFQASYYFPFSVGPRNCIGIKYAMRCVKVMLATLIRTYEFKVNKSIELDKIKLTFDIVLTPAEPFKVKIEKRSNKIV
ncbi:PREDICTED: cytochrome P450 4c21-like isoform X2 [Wasmannia auropunctata]|uniref:cytochrome P450 4c21-like isoform X2 n=1 Tax=Wasmannia auropunctata TaxID=64793 RepID=UPI0005EF6129|nr:PREDICTED: cytochrome P450 4c21-like isoform X2 [Wasmannia auropunctata]